jgi:hypothetical protein
MLSFDIVFDSSSKIAGDGILDATFLIQVGNYDQCLATSGPKDASGVPKFKGKYCLFQPRFQAPQTEMINDAIAASHKIQRLVQQTLVSFLTHCKIDQKFDFVPRISFIFFQNYNLHIFLRIVNAMKKSIEKLSWLKFKIELLLLERKTRRKASCDASLGCVRSFNM